MQNETNDQELSEKDLENVVGGVRIFGIDINLNPTGPVPEPMPQPSSNTTSNKK